MSKYIKVIIITLMLAVYCFAFQGRRHLFDPDEGRYSAVALQMIDSHDWLVPRTHPDHEHWTKPPLAYWAIAGGILTFGKNEFAVRFPNALSFFVTIIVSFFLGRVFVPKRPWIVALIFATFLFPATMCNGATTDYLLTMWETLAVTFFASAYWGKEGSKRLSLTLLMWAAFGLAFLTKGPPGLLPLFSIIIFLWTKSGKKNNFRLYWARGCALMLVVAGSWFAAVIYKNFELVRYFLWDEIVLRVFTAHHARHSSWYAAFTVFLPVLVFGTLPWCYFTGKGLMRSFKTARKRGAPIDSEERSKHQFLLLWIFVPLAIFVVSRSKLPLYILPLFAPLAIVTAKELDICGFSFTKWRTKITFWCALIVLVRPFMASLNFKQDASKFADAIKRRYPNPVEEIAFVGTVPAFGLHFYTGSAIEEVPLEFSALQKQFDEHKSRLWLVLKEEEETFFEKIALHNVRMQKLGDIAARKNYVLFREIIDKI